MGLAELGLPRRRRATVGRCLGAINRPLDATDRVNCTRGPLLWRHSPNLTADTRTFARRRIRRKKLQLTRGGNYSTVNAQMQS